MENYVLSGILAKIQSASTCLLDRWKVSIDSTPPLPPPSRSSSSSSNNQSQKNTSSNKKKPGNPPITSKLFQNYLGIGVDAQIVYNFHHLRDSNPSVFIHQYINKLIYGIMGWREIWNQTCESLPQDLELYQDGKRIPLPRDTQGIVFLNISSYGGGSILWKDETRGNQTIGSSYYSGGMESPYFNQSYDDYHNNSNNNSNMIHMNNSTSQSPLGGSSWNLSPADPTQSTPNSHPNSHHNEKVVEDLLLAAAAASSATSSEDREHPSTTTTTTTNNTNMSPEQSYFVRKPYTPRSSRRPVYQPVAIDDGLLEVVAVKSSFELAQVKLGITSCTKLCQGKQFEIVVKHKLPMQMDGEPWIQSPSKISIRLLHEKQEAKMVMCRPMPDEANLEILRKTLETIQQQQIITKFQSERIMVEYLRQVQQQIE